MSEIGPCDAHIETMPNGRRFYFDRPDFRIEEIAWHLSHLARFTGGIKFFWTVLQHLLLASHIAELIGGDPLEALLHDGLEFAMNDINSPLKRMLPDYKAIEKRLYGPMATQFGIPHQMTDLCHEADGCALIIEADVLLPSRGKNFMVYRQYKHALDMGLGAHVQELPPAFVREAFLARFQDLQRQRNQAGATWLR